MIGAVSAGGKYLGDLQKFYAVKWHFPCHYAAISLTSYRGDATYLGKPSRFHVRFSQQPPRRRLLLMDL